MADERNSRHLEPEKANEEKMEDHSAAKNEEAEAPDDNSFVTLNRKEIFPVRLFKNSQV